MNPSQKTITTLLVLTLFLSACAPRAESVPPTATPSSAPTATVTATMIPTETLTPPPPTETPVPTPARPNAPENLKMTFTCLKENRSNSRSNHGYHITITLTWDDKSNNETGFEIYKDTGLWKTVEANTTQIMEDIYSRTVIFETTTYTILAFNDAGKSKRVEQQINYSCP